MVKDYAQSFKDVLVYEKSNPKDPNVLKDFTKTIDKIRDRHTNTGEKIVKWLVFYYPFFKNIFCKNVPFSFENFSHHHGRSSDGNETFSNFSTKKWKKRKRKQTATLHAKYSGT